MTPLHLIGIVYSILSQGILTSAVPMPGQVLPKIILRHDSQPLPASTAISTDVQLIPGDGTHGKRENRRQDANRLRKARFYPYDPADRTASIDGIAESSPTSVPTTFTSLLTTSFSNITFDPQTSTTSSIAAMITDENPSPPTSPISLQPGIRTFPPTTAVSIAPAPLPQPEPNLATESASLPVLPSTTMSSSSSFSEGPDCPFATRGQPQPTTESTSNPAFPIIVTVFPIPAETSSAS